MGSQHGSRVLITGGAGFIGSHLAEHLFSTGIGATMLLDDFSSGRRSNLAALQGKIGIIEADIRDVSWEALLGSEQYEVIYHLASNAYVPPSVDDPMWDYGINLHGTLRLLDTLRTLRWPGRLIYFSSGAVYGDPARLPIAEGDSTMPISPYGVSKLASERYIAVYSRLYGIKAASLRLFSVYGPRQSKQVVYDLIRKLQADPNDLRIFGTGSVTRDFNYVGDTVRAAALVAARGALEGETYNVASGRECSLAELTETLCRVMRVQPRLHFSGAVRPGDPEHWAVDIARLAGLGYRPSVSLEEGLGRTVAWCRESDRDGDS